MRVERLGDGGAAGRWTSLGVLGIMASGVTEL